ncbi:hypothetical protein LQ567_16590 [Niabella pedocola]|uniref:Uncharacterized protein n=1 Tax=Niabella pedocola TaxID=1752077 RepID=A0ABS8PTJ6_9BACT|nr:hypothetical protein [Niabella pedocola]MCD2424400.1 hypothetical protein [Niabella pedocola]
MLEQISWNQFLIAIGGAAAAYYAILIVSGKIKFKKTKVHREPTVFEFSPERKASPPSNPPSEAPVSPKGRSEMTGPDDSKDSGDTEFAMLEQLADELQVIIVQVGSTQGNRELLLENMTKIIAGYPSLNKPAFIRAINNLMMKVVSEECSFTITEEEAALCWPQLPYVDQK